MLARAQAIKRKNNLEIEKGHTLEGWACSANEDSWHASELGCSLSKGTGPDLCELSGETQVARPESSQAAWLGKVTNKWEKMLYLTGSDWSARLPDGARTLLTENFEEALAEKKWLDFSHLREAWNM